MGSDAKSAFGLGHMVHHRDSTGLETSLGSNSHVAVPVSHFFWDHHYR
jgi:hypothetical protein